MKNEVKVGENAIDRAPPARHSKNADFDNLYKIQFICYHPQFHRSDSPWDRLSKEIFTTQKNELIQSEK